MQRFSSSESSTATAAHQNCWGDDHYVGLSLEHGYPRDLLPAGGDEQAVADLDLPRIGPNAYRAAYGREVVYLHIYRPSNNKHIDLDDSVKLTATEHAH